LPSPQEPPTSPPREPSASLPPVSPAREPVASVIPESPPVQPILRRETVRQASTSRPTNNVSWSPEVGDTPSIPLPTRRTRSSTASLPSRQPRYGYDGTQGHGYMAVPSVLPRCFGVLVSNPHVDMAQHIRQPYALMAPIFAHRFIPTLFLDSGCSTPAAYKASLSDPDTMTYE
jgi:hypothetical protein